MTPIRLKALVLAEFEEVSAVNIIEW